MKQGRPSTGTILWRNGQWHVRITREDGTKTPFIPLGTELGEGDVERARALAKIVSDSVRSGAIVPEASAETVNEWFERWLEVREQKGLRSVRTDRSRGRTHILPHIGHLDVKSVARAHVEKLVEHLDEGIVAGTISWKTAANAWGLLTKMFGDARQSKKVGIRVREDDPCENVEGPDRGAWKAKAYLYPSEFLLLVRCEDVPLRWRRLFAIAVYLYLRRGELAALKRSDVDLEHGIVHIHSSEGENKGDVKGTKTGLTRRVRIEDGLMPLMRTLCAGLAPNDLLMRMPPEDRLSGSLRQYLKVAGIARTELYVTDGTRKNITWHDLRATGITWLAVRGEAPLRIQRRAGHTNLQTTQRYIREAENIDSDYGTVFPVLPSVLSSDIDLDISGGRPSKTSIKSRTNECEGGDLNPTDAIEIIEDFDDDESEMPEIVRTAPVAGRNDLTSLVACIRRATEAGQWEAVKALSELLTTIQ